MHLSNRKARALAQESRERGDSVVKHFIRRLDEMAAGLADDMEKEFEAQGDDEEAEEGLENEPQDRHP